MTAADPAGPVIDAMAYAVAGDVAHVRSFVRAAALDRGLPAVRVELLVLAASELATNTIQHTTGGGRVRVWREQHQVVCEVADAGTDKAFAQMPGADSFRGRGLAIVKRVVDELTTFATAGGSVVQLRMNG
ncbi:MAG TPA: ATP-binding protein [Micromonosporaceae bacterium]|jgi:anti-sigma regulatory factor (Ser/Thr protein kinase)